MGFLGIKLIFQLLLLIIKWIVYYNFLILLSFYIILKNVFKWIFFLKVIFLINLSNFNIKIYDYRK